MFYPCIYVLVTVFHEPKPAIECDSMRLRAQDNSLKASAFCFGHQRTQNGCAASRATRFG